MSEPSLRCRPSEAGSDRGTQNWVCRRRRSVNPAVPAHDAGMLVGTVRGAVDRRRALPVLVGLTAGGWAIGLVTTAVVASSTFLTFGIHSRSAHLMLDTADTCVALLLAYLLWGRFRRTRRLQDLLLAQGFLLLAASGGVLLLVHLAAGVERPGRWDVWSAVAVRVAAAGLVLAAAAVGRDRLVASGVRLVVAGPFVVLGPVLAGLVVLREHLPGALPIAFPAGATHPDITGPTALLVAQAAGAV